MTFNSEANAKFCLDFFHRLRKDHPEENIVFSPLNMSTALHLLHHGSRGDSAAEIEKVLHLSDEKEHLSPESRENSEEASVSDDSEVSLTTSLKNDPDDKYLMSTETSEECITEAKSDQDETDQAQSKSLAEVCETREGSSVLDLLQPPETDAREIERSLVHTSISSDSQSTIDEGASDSFLSGSENIPPEEGVAILSPEQPSSEGESSHDLVDTSKNQSGLVADINSSAEETKIVSDNSDDNSDTESIHSYENIPPEEGVDSLSPEQPSSEGESSHDSVDTSKNQGDLVADINSSAEETKIVSDNFDDNSDTENIHSSSSIYPANQGNGEDTETKRGISSLVIHQVSEAGDQKPVTEHHSAQNRDSSSPQSDIANVVPRREDEFLSQDQSSPEDQNQVKSPESHSESMTFTESFRLDSDEDASSDFLPWSADYPEKEDEVISQGRSTPENNVPDYRANKQVPPSRNNSDATNPSRSISEAEGVTGLDNGHIKKLEMNSEDSVGEGGNTLPDTKTTHRQKHRTSGHNMGYYLSSAEFAIFFSYDLPWYKYLLGREQREILRQACYELMRNITEPIENRMYNYIARTKQCPLALE